MTIHMKVVVGAVLVAAVLTNSASAGVILSSTTIPPGPPVASGPGLGFVSVPAIITLSPGNDNVPPSGLPDNNIVVPLKRFDFNDYIDIEFSVLSTGPPTFPVTEYQVTEFVDNNTGLPWAGYNMYLGFGTGAGFVLSAPGDGLDFDSPTYDTPPSSTAFPPPGTPNEDTLLYSGGIHGSGAQQYTFRIDVPNLVPLGVSTFTLRQIPVPIPEPNTILLLALALVGVVSHRRRG